MEKVIKTGAEIWELIKHPLLNESDWKKDREYEFIDHGRKTKNGVMCTESFPILTSEEQAIADYEAEMQKALDDLEDIEKKIAALS